jgi:hypothetical protein
MALLAQQVRAILVAVAVIAMAVVPPQGEVAVAQVVRVLRLLEAHRVPVLVVPDWQIP